MCLRKLTWYQKLDQYFKHFLRRYHSKITYCLKQRYNTTVYDCRKIQDRCSFHNNNNRKLSILSYAIITACSPYPCCCSRKVAMLLSRACILHVHLRRVVDLLFASQIRHSCMLQGRSCIFDVIYIHFSFVADNV